MFVFDEVQLSANLCIFLSLYHLVLSVHSLCVCVSAVLL